MFGQVGGKRGQEGVVNNFSRCYGDVSPNLFVNNKFHFSSSATAPSAPLRVRNSTTVDLLGMGYWCPVSMSNKIFVRVGQPREQPLGVCSLCPQNSANAGGMPLFDHFHVFPPSPPLHVFSFVSRTHLSIPFAQQFDCCCQLALSHVPRQTKSTRPFSGANADGDIRATSFCRLTRYRKCGLQY